MAKFGANYPCFMGKKKEKGVIIGKLVSANLTVNMASGELYADDALAEQISEFSSGTIAMETDDMDAAVAAEIYGCTVSEDNTVTYKAGDNAPTGSLGYYKVLMRKGVKAYEGYYYPKVRAALGNDNAQTKSGSITFQTTSTTFTVFADDNTDWRVTKLFDTDAEARKWIDEKLAIQSVQEPPAGS